MMFVVIMAKGRMSVKMCYLGRVYMKLKTSVSKLGNVNEAACHKPSGSFECENQVG